MDFVTLLGAGVCVLGAASTRIGDRSVERERSVTHRKTIEDQPENEAEVETLMVRARSRLFEGGKAVVMRRWRAMMGLSVVAVVVKGAMPLL